MKWIFVFVLFTFLYAQCNHGVAHRIAQLSETETLQSIAWISVMSSCDVMQPEILCPEDGVVTMMGGSSQEAEKRVTELLKLEVPLTGNALRVVRSQLFQVMEHHLARSSLFWKIRNVFSFANILLILGVMCAVATLCFFIRDYLARMYVLVRWMIDTTMVDWIGIQIAAYCMILKPIEGYWYYTPFDHQTCLFGALLFHVCAAHAFHVLCISRSDRPILSYNALFLLFFVADTAAAIWQQNEALGILAVLTMYGANGFFSQSIDGGYVFGFQSAAYLWRCYGISIASFVLYASFIVRVPWIGVFGTGIVFVGTFVGLLASNIVGQHYRDKYPAVFLVQVPLSCLASMYVGCVTPYASACSIGGTFFFFWMLDVQRSVLHRIFPRATWLGFFAFWTVNLLAVYVFLRQYPGFFIFT